MFSENFLQRLGDNGKSLAVMIFGIASERISIHSWGDYTKQLRKLINFSPQTL
jgi:hypothetical protein